jgi:hypothetical protein
VQEALKRKNALAQGKKLFTCTWANCGHDPDTHARTHTYTPTQMRACTLARTPILSQAHARARIMRAHPCAHTLHVGTQLMSRRGVIRDATRTVHEALARHHDDVSDKS